MSRSLLTTLLSFIIIINIGAQKTKKWDAIISDLNKSDFISDYTAKKDFIEENIAQLKSEIEFLNPNDVKTIENSYGELNERFDLVLNKIKSDLKDKGMRSFMKKNPEQYFNGFYYNLDEAYKFYNNEIARKSDSLTNNSIGAFGLAEITIILGLIKEFGALIQKRIDKVNKISEEYFENQFLAPLRLKSWNEY